MRPVQKKGTFKGARGPAQLDLLQPIHNLVEIKDEMSTIGNEESAGAIQSCVNNFFVFKKKKKR